MRHRLSGKGVFMISFDMKTVGNVVGAQRPPCYVAVPDSPDALAPFRALQAHLWDADGGLGCIGYCIPRVDPEYLALKAEVEFLLPFPCFPCLPPLPSAGLLHRAHTVLDDDAGGAAAVVSDAVSLPVSALDLAGIAHLPPRALSCGLACLFSPGSCFVEAGLCTHVCRRWPLVNLA